MKQRISRTGEAVTVNSESMNGGGVKARMRVREIDHKGIAPAFAESLNHLITEFLNS